jgi:hypothetical protein
MAELAFGEDAEELGGVVASGSSWIDLTDTAHSGKVGVAAGKGPPTREREGRPRFAWLRL